MDNSSPAEAQAERGDVPTSLSELVARREFRMQLVAGLTADPSVMDASLLQAHSSDLPDPTPWLEPGQLLLTDGLQFDLNPDAAQVDPYVERLRGSGIRALGFAAGVVHDRVPITLVEACDRVGLPLIEVASSTPFMAVIRHVADVQAADQRARLEWSLSAQRAVARAALRPDGLGAVIRELEKQLNCWVALYDAAGHRIRIETQIELSPETALLVTEQVRLALARGTRAGVRLSEPTAEITLLTLGQRNRLRGVLAVGKATPLDPAGHDLISSVIGLASIALEQSRALDDSRRQLRAGVLELLLSGAAEAAGKAAGGLVGRLPAQPVRAFVVPGPGPARALLDDLELYADRRAGRVFFAQRADELVVLTRADDTLPLEQLLKNHRVVAGASSPTVWAGLPAAISQGHRAVRYAPREGTIVWFDDLAQHGLLGFLDSAGGLPVAETILHPILAHADGGSEMLNTLHIWMAFNCSWDPAAKALGVHRHTLRNRVAAAEKLLNVDFQRFGDRVEVWAAMELLQHTASPPAHSSNS